MLVKFPEEVCLCLGVAQIEKDNGTVEGVRCNSLDYMNSKIV